MQNPLFAFRAKSGQVKSSQVKSVESLMLFNSPGPDAQEPEVILDSPKRALSRHCTFHEHFPILDGIARAGTRS